MRKLVLFSFISVSAFIYGCGGNLSYNQSQPASGETISKIPDILHGKYFATDMESVITVLDSVILRTYDFDMKFNKDSLPEGGKLKGDTIVISYMDGYTDKQKINFINASEFTYHEHFTDTVFKLFEFSAIKKYKGVYFLNDKLQTDSNSYTWDVRKLSLKKGMLLISYIDDIDLKDIEKMKEYIFTAEDTITFNFKKQDKQFRTYTENDEYEITDTFYRMKP